MCVNAGVSVGVSVGVNVCVCVLYQVTQVTGSVKRGGLGGRSVLRQAAPLLACCYRCNTMHLNASPSLCAMCLLSCHTTVTNAHQNACVRSCLKGKAKRSDARVTQRIQDVAFIPNVLRHLVLVVS